MNLGSNVLIALLPCGLVLAPSGPEAASLAERVTTLEGQAATLQGHAAPKRLGPRSTWWHTSTEEPSGPGARARPMRGN